MVTVTASLVDSADCLSQQEDETSEDHEVRCSARVEVNVVRRTTAPIIVKAPVNPPGATPETLSDSEGVANAVFTPVEGGSFAGDGYPLVAGAGAVTNGGIHRGEHGARGRCIERRDDVASLHPQRSALRDRGGGRKRRSGFGLRSERPGDGVRSASAGASREHCGYRSGRHRRWRRDGGATDFGEDHSGRSLGVRKTVDAAGHCCGRQGWTAAGDGGFHGRGRRG